MTDKPSPKSVSARPRKIERVYLVLAIIGWGLLVFFFLVGKYKLNPQVGMLLLILLAIVFVVLFHEKPPFNANDAIKLCMRERRKYWHEPLNPLKAEVQPRAGADWIVDFTENALAFYVDPVNRYITGFRVKTADEMLKQMERSEILRSNAQQALAAQAEEEALSALGYDTDDMKPKGDDDD